MSGQRLGMQQRLQQKLSPQQIQLMKLLQVPTASLEVRIKEEMEENPALELEDANSEEYDENNDEFAENGEEEYEDADGGAEEYENIDISDYVKEGDDDIADINYGMKAMGMMMRTGEPCPSKPRSVFTIF